MKDYEIIPFKQVADISFDNTVDDLLKMGYQVDPEWYDDITKWQTYSKPEYNLICDVNEEGEIVTIVCLFNYYYQGIPLKGKTPDEIALIFGSPSEIQEAYEADVAEAEPTLQTPYNYDKYGLQILYVQGKVSSVCCFHPIPEEGYC